jgi:hypothetical protein
MSSADQQSTLNSTASARNAGTTFTASSQDPSSHSNSANTEGQATAFGHGQHPNDHADDSQTQESSTAYGVDGPNLDGEQLATYAEGKVMHAQLDKGKVGGFGEEESQTAGLDRKRAEHDRMLRERGTQGGGQGSVGGQRLGNEDLSAV